MQSIATASVSTVLSLNALVAKAQRGARMTIKFVCVPLEELHVIGWCDASFANAQDGRSKDADLPLASHAGYMVGFAREKDVAQG